MNWSRFCKAAKKAAEYFSAAAGAAVFLIAVVGAFVVIPPFISLPIAAGIGIAFAIHGYRNAAREHDEHQRTVQRRDEVRGEFKRELNEIKLGLDMSLSKQYQEKKLESEQKQHCKPLLRSNSHARLFSHHVVAEQKHPDAYVSRSYTV